MRFDEVTAAAWRVATPAGCALPHLARRAGRQLERHHIEASKLTLESPEGSDQSHREDRRTRAEVAASAGRNSAGARASTNGPARCKRPARTRKPSSSAPHSICRSRCVLLSTLAPAGMRATGDAWRAHLTVERFDPHPLITTDAFDSVAAGTGRGRQSRGPVAARRVDARREIASSSNNWCWHGGRNCCRYPLSRPGSILNPPRSPAPRRWPSMAAGPHPCNWPGTSSSCPRPGPARDFVARARSRPPRAWNASR